MTATVAQQARGAPWIRQAGELVGVSFPERTIELIVIPYEHEITVNHPTKPGAGPVQEIITRGAFDGIERRANRIKANREHDKTLTFGRVATFRAGDEQGLHAKVRVARTLLGDETLSLAEDECLEASAGFWPEVDKQGRFAGLRWENPGRYRITKAFLDHIALVSEGAYGERAGVLAVRAAVAPTPVEARATPILDEFLAEMQREKEAELDRRFGSPVRSG